MPTHCAVIQRTNNGYKGAYVHFDGTPAAAGEALKLYYKDPKVISELIDLGSIPSIRENVRLTRKNKMSYDWSEFEKQPQYAPQLKNLIRKIPGVHYVYVYVVDRWRVIEMK